MSTKRISMRKLREILKLRLHSELSLRQIRGALRLSLGAVQKVLRKAEELELNWQAIEQRDDKELALQFYPKADPHVSKNGSFPTGVMFIKNSNERVLPNISCGKSIPNTIPTGVTAIRNIVSYIRTG